MIKFITEYRDAIIFVLMIGSWALGYIVGRERGYSDGLEAGHKKGFRAGRGW